MLGYRISRAAYADLTGEGARLYGGRWNTVGRPMVYLASTPSLAVLEVRVHLDLDYDVLPDDYVLLTIDLGRISVETLNALPPDDAACAAFGDAWLIQQRSAVLQVPSIIVPEDTNLLLNPAHPQAIGAQETGRRAFQFDPRLWSAT